MISSQQLQIFGWVLFGFEKWFDKIHQEEIKIHDSKKMKSKFSVKKYNYKISSLLGTCGGGRGTELPALKWVTDEIMLFGCPKDHLKRP
jgi:hypothetical protein